MAMERDIYQIQFDALESEFKVGTAFKETFIAIEERFNKLRQKPSTCDEYIRNIDQIYFLFSAVSNDPTIFEATPVIGLRNQSIQIFTNLHLEARGESPHNRMCDTRMKNLPFRVTGNYNVDLEQW